MEVVVDSNIFFRFASEYFLKINSNRAEVRMKYNPDIHYRRSIRLKGYDYSQNGLYFITSVPKIATIYSAPLPTTRWH
jgi:hypothetical protein